jgi:hypothetical protein
MHLLFEARAGLILASPFVWLASCVAGHGPERVHLRLITSALVVLLLATRPSKVTS